MSTLKVIIVDDEPLARKRVRDLLRDEPDIQVLAESGDGLDAMHKIRHLTPDVVFLDIKMPGLSGLELIRKIPADKRPCIVFTTAYGEHAVDAFGVDAVDYLMKPFEKSRFHETLTKARTRLAGRQGGGPAFLDLMKTQLHHLTSAISGNPAQRIAVKDGTHLKFVVLSDIIHLQADGDYLHIHSVNAEHVMIRERMHSMQGRLPNPPFLRISRSSIVNFNQVLEIKPAAHGDYELLLSNGERVTTGKTYRDQVRTLVSEINPVNPL